MRVSVSLCLMIWVLLNLRSVHYTTQEVQSNLGEHFQCKDGPFVQIKYGYDLNQFIGWSKGEQKFVVPWGTTIYMKCGCSTDENADRLTVTRYGEKIVTDKPYLNVISWFKEHYDLLLEDVYVCTDIKTNCTSSIIAIITPELNVISDNTLIHVDKYHVNFTVQYASSFSVLCSGVDADRLYILRDGMKLSAERENNATIRHFVKKSDRQISEYACADVNSTYNRSIIIKVVPAIYLISGNESITPVHFYFDSLIYYFEHRESIIEFYCAGMHVVKVTGHGENDDFSLTNVNKTMIKFTKKFKVGETYFNCSDSEFPDYVNRVKVLVIPRMEVMSSNIGYKDGNNQYGINYGNSLEIICTGTDSNELDIMYSEESEAIGEPNKGVKLTLNETSIKYVLQKIRMDGIYNFFCFKESPLESNNAEIQVGVLPADIKDFHCVSHNGKYLNCSWTSPSDKINFRLSYVENGFFKRICEKPRTSRKLKFCVLDYEFNNKQKGIIEFTFVLLSCNSFSCSNQTFLIDHLSIVKPAAPWGLEVITTSQSAVISWIGGGIAVAGEDLNDYRESYRYKVQYWYSGIEPRIVNTSVVTCTYRGCECKIDLPCPGQFYEVMIYQKIKKIENEFWSDPGIVTFATKDAEDNGIVDPSCNQEPKKTEEVMTYFVQKLAQDVRQEAKQMKLVVRSLQDKLANIRKNFPGN